MTYRLESADRYWEIERDGKRLIIRNGALGEPPKVAVEKFWFEGRAAAAYEARIATQLSAGFNEVVAAPEPTARNWPLEDAIRMNRDDPGPYEVYADWLQEHENPFGELILLQRALEQASDPGKQLRMGELRRALGADKPDAFTVEWKWGFWRSLRIDNALGHEVFDAEREVDAAFKRFACTQLDELRIGSLRWDHNAIDIPSLIGNLRYHGWAYGVRRLYVGDTDEIDLGMYSVGGIGERITESLPNLEALRVATGDEYGDHPQGYSERVRMLSFAGLRLHRLERFTLETCSLSRRVLEQICLAELPKLTALELWFGSAEYGADCTIADLAPILDGEAFPHLTSLGLCNFELEDQLARMIHTAKIAPQLTHLNLSKGTLDDESALVLAGHRDALPALTTLDVSDNFLTQIGVDALRAAFSGVAIEAGDQRTATGDRYVAVAE